eukprot:scaffold6961_cov145-Isochrysis_galbana.AAC.4
MDRHDNGLIERGILWVLPTVKGAIKGSGRTLALYGGVAVLELRRCFCNGTGGRRKIYCGLGSPGLKHTGQL